MTRVEQRGLKKMGIQIRILERTLDRNVHGVTPFTQDMDALLPQVLKRGNLSRKKRTSIPDMFGDRQVK
jgi:hypothetical protein